MKQRKTPAKRMFSGLAGSALAIINMPNPVQGLRTATQEQLVLARKFLLFLWTRQLSIENLLVLSNEEQEKLKYEFFKTKDNLVLTRITKPIPVKTYGPIPAGYWEKILEEEEFNRTYDPNKYRKEINTALRSVRDIRWDIGDLVQIIDFEIWKATKKYDSEMNGKLAYTIAKNQAMSFLKTKKESKKESKLPLDVSTGEGFETSPVGLSLEADPNLSPDAIVMGSEQDAVQSRDTLVSSKHPQLEAYVQGLRGDARKVGEAILADPGAGVRDIETKTGVPKSTVDRIRKGLFVRFGDIVKSLQ